MFENIEAVGEVLPDQVDWVFVGFQLVVWLWICPGGGLQRLQLLSGCLVMLLFVWMLARPRQMS